MMDWRQLKERWASATWAGTAPFNLPTALLEIEPDFVLGARLAGRSTGRSNGPARPASPVQRLGICGLEPQELNPSPNSSGIPEGRDLSPMLRRVLEVVGNGTARFGLIVPDGMVRVGILPFEMLPADRREADALIRWRMKENLPFPAAEARISYQVMSGDQGQVEVLALAAKGSVLAEYETALEMVEANSVLILPATITLLPLIPDVEGPAQLLIHLCGGWVTHTVLTGNRVRFWRTRQLRSDGWLPEVVAEGVRVMAASQDHLQVEIGRVWLCARPPATRESIEELARALRHDVDPLTLDTGLVAGLSEEERKVFEWYGATIAGLLENDSQ